MSIQFIGNLVRERRKLFHLTQQDLSEMADVSHNTIRKIELGRANPTVGVLSKLGKVLGFRLELNIPHTINHPV